MRITMHRLRRAQVPRPEPLPRPSQLFGPIEPLRPRRWTGESTGGHNPDHPQGKKPEKEGGTLSLAPSDSGRNPDNYDQDA